jgi:arylsulfatase A-like enzyme
MRYLALAVLTLVAGSLRADEPRRPNIVFIFSDDHAYQAIGAYGDPRKLLDTPNIDRIGKTGMRFDRCLVPNSICGPSRATVLTGKYSHVNGFYNNTNSKFDGSQVTFPKLLQTAGYQTAIIGKWHLVSQPTGFDYWHILPGQGRYYNPPMIDNGKPVQHDGYVTDVITDLSLDWLNKRDKGKPFVLMCQHKAPHREWSPALRHLGHDKDRDYPEPETLFDDYAGRGKAEHAQDMTIKKTMNDLDLKFSYPPGINDEQKKEWDRYYKPRNDQFSTKDMDAKAVLHWRYNRYMHDYLGCIKAVDESVGKLLDYLDKEGLADNTIVMYASDQGFYLGEHGWFDKRWIFEESLKTPCLVRWPGVTKPGTVNGEIVSNLDFAPTFLEAAGVEVPKEVQGRSLYYHYYEYPGPHAVHRHYGVVTDRYKLIRFYEPEVNEWELFDLKSDPNEMKSVYGNPEYVDVQKQLHAELDRLRAELKVPDPDPAETMIKANPKKSNPKK